MATLELVVDGQKFTVEVGDASRSPVTVVVNGVTKSVSFSDAAASQAVVAAQPVAATPVPAAPAAEAPAVEPVVETAPVGSASGQVVAAPMPGKILSVLVTVGQAISEGDAVCTLEAMKMEMPINSSVSGTVNAIHVQVGQSVPNDAPLVTIG